MNNFNPIIGENKIPEFISVISSSKCARIRIEDIEVIEQEGRRLHVITADREYSFYESMKDVIMCLYGRAFYRPVKGLIINFNHVKEISGTTVSFHSGHIVTMGKNSITRTRSSYKKYLMRFPPYTMVDVKPTVMQVAESGLLGPAETMRVLERGGSGQHSDDSEGEDAISVKEIKEAQVAHIPMRVTYAQAAREASLSYTSVKADPAIRNSCHDTGGRPQYPALHTSDSDAAKEYAVCEPGAGDHGDRDTYGYSIPIDSCYD